MDRDNSSIPAGTIVVGVDGSETAARALDWAIGEAVLGRCDLTLVHGVGDALAAGSAGLRGDVTGSVDAAVAGGRALLTEAMGQVNQRAPEVTVRCVLRLASAHQTLLSLVDDAAMVVVGPHTHGPRSQQSLSVADELFAGPAGAPVDIAGDVQHGAGTGLAVLTDGTPLGRATLELAFRQAELLQMPLTVILVLADPAGGGTEVDLWLMDVTAREEARVGASLLGFQRTLLMGVVRGMGAAHPDVDVTLVVEDDEVDAALTTLATDKAVVVLSSRHAMRAAEQVFHDYDPTKVRCVTVVQPCEVIDVNGEDVDQLMVHAERRAVSSEVAALEELFAEPTVVPQHERELVPALVRRRAATRHLLHRMTERDDRREGH